MTIKLRSFRTGGYEVDIHTRTKKNEPIRERVKSPVGSKEASKRWALLREAHLAEEHGPGGCTCKAATSEDEAKLEQQRLWLVKRYLVSWCEQRRAEQVPTADQEEQRLRDHVVPVIGSIRMCDLRPRHANMLVKKLKITESDRGGLLANRTVRGIYFTFKQAIQDAVLEEILVGNPIVVGKKVLPPVIDKDPTWRPGAKFSAPEVEMLISDPKVAEHRRVAYGIEFITGLRTGQVSALTWGDYEPDIEPLGRIVSAFSYNSQRKVVTGTKTKVTHEVPVHPTLARILAAWKLQGWKRRHGRAPKQADLIIPTINNTHRDVRKALEDFHEDLERLGLRKRRHYDSRRSFISLGLDGGASKDILTTITHPRPRDSFDLYRTVAWETKCEAVMKLKIELKEGRVLPMPKLAAVGGTGELAETEGDSV